MTRHSPPSRSTKSSYSARPSFTSSDLRIAVFTHLESETNVTEVPNLDLPLDVCEQNKSITALHLLDKDS